MIIEKKHRWLFSRSIDLSWLYMPVWITWIVFFMMPDPLLDQDVAVWVWLVFVIGIDVSHVWSTIFRTYTDKEEFANHRNLLIFAPIIAFVFFFLASAYSQPLFWRILAYIALYHFIKQQYGFMRIYKAKAGDFRNRLIKDEWVIYAGMLYPVIYWHLTDKRNFSWFVEGDFLNAYQYLSQLPMDTVFSITNTVFWLFIGVWLVQEIFYGTIRLYGKILWILTTAVNWYLGIVYFNSDLVFTITNIVAHGIPYLVLIFFYVEKKKDAFCEGTTENYKITKLLSRIGVMLLVVLLLAFGEEYLWDMWIYRDHSSLFEALIPFPFEAFSTRWLQAFGIALLTVPQATHYIIDGFIWKNGPKNPHLKKVFFK